MPSRCNYCTLKGIERHAATAGATVEIRPRPTEHSAAGVDIYVNYPGDDEPTWAAWLMKLPERCAC